MNGPEHYREAERLLRLSGELPPSAAEDIGAITVAQAQVHATLALAAATAAPSVRDWLGEEDRSGSDWTRVTA